MLFIALVLQKLCFIALVLQKQCFIALVLQKECCSLRLFCFAETILFVALVLQKQCCLLRLFCFAETMFIALILQEQCCLLRWFYRKNVFTELDLQERCCLLRLFYRNNVVYCAGFAKTIFIHYGTFFFIIFSYESPNKSPVDEAVRVTCTLHSNRTVTTSSALHKNLFCLRGSVHSGSCDHRMHFRKTQMLAIIAAVFGSYASIVSKLKGYDMVTSVHFAVTKLLSTSGSSRAAQRFTNIVTELAPVGERSEFDAMSVTM
jgi:hypothetical protein